MNAKRLLLAVPLLLAVQTAAVSAQVIVNGMRLSRSQVATLERTACRPIPAGNYWLNKRGQWGFAGNPWPQGHLTERCRTARPPSRQSQAQTNLKRWRSQSLSKRGMLFGPGDY